MAAGGLLVAAGLWARPLIHQHAVADADNGAVLARGATIYAQHCASCHGRRLQGQALWQINDAGAGRRAPALDQTGRAWQLPDNTLYRLVELGSAGTTSQAMPAFESRLGAPDIRAVIAFIKARWPSSLGALQAALNPGQPVGKNTSWRLPAFCRW